MPTIHDYLLHHYGNRDQPKNKFHKVESVVRKSYARKINEEDPTSPYADFLRNESKIACESAPLDFRELPRSLKVYFPKPKTPPPQLP